MASATWSLLDQYPPQSIGYWRADFFAAAVCLAWAPILPRARKVDLNNDDVVLGSRLLDCLQLFAIGSLLLGRFGQVQDNDRNFLLL